jgi:hypothetical protein
LLRNLGLYFSNLTVLEQKNKLFKFFINWAVFPKTEIMVKRTILLAFLILYLTAGNLFSQKVFRDGYIVKKSGETLNGIVEYSVKQGTPSECKFKRFDIATEVVYTADDLKAFGYKNGNRYESGEYNGKTSFYEVLVSGKIVLLAKGSEFFVEKDNFGIISLGKLPITYYADGNKTEFKTVSEFIRFLTEGKTPVIDKLNLKNDLEPIITEYNRKSGEETKVYNRTMSAVTVEKMVLASGANMNIFGAMAGVGGYMLNMKKLEADYVPAPATEFCPVLGLSYERLLSRKSGKLSVSVELLGYRQTFYVYSEYNRYNEYLSEYNGIFRNDAFYDFTAVKVPLMLRYSLSGNRFVPYANAGVAFQYVIDHNFRHIEEFENSSHEVSTNEYEDFTFNPQEISVLAGIGVRTRLFNDIFLNLQGRIEYGSGIFKITSEYIDSFKQYSIQPSILLSVTF